jgi:hypothetical protein
MSVDAILVAAASLDRRSLPNWLMLAATSSSGSEKFAEGKLRK